MANRLKDAGFDARGAEGMARALWDEFEGRVVTVPDLNAKITSVDRGVEALDRKFGALDTKVEALDAKIDLIAARLGKRIEQNNRWMIFVASILFAAVLAGGVPQYLRMFGVWQPLAMSTPATSVVQQGTRPAAVRREDSRNGRTPAAAAEPR